jgi:hypothetical protein
VNRMSATCAAAASAVLAMVLGTSGCTPAPDPEGVVFLSVSPAIASFLPRRQVVTDEEGSAWIVLTEHDLATLRRKAGENNGAAMAALDAIGRASGDANFNARISGGLCALAKRGSQTAKLACSVRTFKHGILVQEAGTTYEAALSDLELLMGSHSANHIALWASRCTSDDCWKIEEISHSDPLRKRLARLAAIPTRGKHGCKDNWYEVKEECAALWTAQFARIPEKGDVPAVRAWLLDMLGGATPLGSYASALSARLGVAAELEKARHSYLEGVSAAVEHTGTGDDTVVRHLVSAIHCIANRNCVDQDVFPSGALVFAADPVWHDLDLRMDVRCRANARWWAAVATEGVAGLYDTDFPSNLALCFLVGRGGRQDFEAARTAALATLFRQAGLRTDANVVAMHSMHALFDRPDAALGYFAMQVDGISTAKDETRTFEDVSRDDLARRVGSASAAALQKRAGLWERVRSETHGSTLDALKWMYVLGMVEVRWTTAS